MSADRILLYLLRRDLRISDNPVFHRLASTSDHGFTHLLPVFVFPPDQVELSGFLEPGQKSPFPPAKSKIAKFWRCGPHRAKFLAEAVWDLKTNLEARRSGLIVRFGPPADVVASIIQHAQSRRDALISAVWMTEDVGYEEKQQQKTVSAVCSGANVDFTLVGDEKYYIEDRHVTLHKNGLPDVFTAYRKAQEPLRDKPRAVLPDIVDALPPLPSTALIAPQQPPFQVPENLDTLQSRLSKPLVIDLPNPPPKPTDVESAHPFTGGETGARQRLRHLVQSGAIASYADTRNGMLGTDFSTKLSAYLSLGCLTARQVHGEMVKYEDGTDTAYQHVDGYGQGENAGTRALRFELLWRDYMRLCTKKFGTKLFKASGFRQANGYAKKWKTAQHDSASPDQDPSPDKVMAMIQRFCQGDTGMGLIDASQRELLATGYTSNRARQNVASFLSKHLDIDWRYGAEWYECMLVDYDTCSNWANWQYVAGVGNDPRGDARIFNPVKQAYDYDKEGDYVRAWIPEIRGFQDVENVFQAWTASPEQLEKLGLDDKAMVTDPLKKIDFNIGRKPKSQRKYVGRARGSTGGGRGGGRGGSGGGPGLGPGYGGSRGGAPLITQSGMYNAPAMMYGQAYSWSMHGNGNGMGMGMGMGMGLGGMMGGSMHHDGSPPQAPQQQQQQQPPPQQQQWGGHSDAPVVSSGWVTRRPTYGMQVSHAGPSSQSHGHMHQGGGGG